MKPSVRVVETRQSADRPFKTNNSKLPNNPWLQGLFEKGFKKAVFLTVVKIRGC
jgi:hypothetical protein